MSLGACLPAEAVRRCPMPSLSPSESGQVPQSEGNLPGPSWGIRLLVLVPAYNPGMLLESTIRSVLGFHTDVWLLVDGSTDGSDEGLEAVFCKSAGFRVIRRRLNKGKGETVLEGAQIAFAQGFTHVLCFDSDGQHPADRIPDFLSASQSNPGAVVMGEPRFGRDAPLERVYFRRLANACVWIETGGRLRWDSLFGMRVYPVEALLEAFAQTNRGRGYDFETEIAVRMIWNGLGVIGIRTKVIYPHPTRGGVSHFHYVRDCLLLAAAHARLLGEALVRVVRGTLR
jgi:glycosyltransferase involved in cell wall biosynthesis